MKIAGKTDKGIVRDINEDSIFFDDSICILADGMGGHMAGDVASKEAILNIGNFWLKNKDDISDTTELLIKSIQYSNKIIFDKAKSDDKLKGMGTTIAITVLKDEKLFYAHVGDSRIYLFKNNVLRKLTTDHSLVEQLLQAGQISRKEARNYPSKNVITKAVGTSEDIMPDVGCTELEKGDLVIICSDGLTNMLSKYKMTKIIKENIFDLDKMVECFIDKANQAGGQDNISVICWHY